MTTVEGTSAPSDARPPGPAPATPGAAGFVWAVWAAMLLLSLVYVGRFSSRHPYFDDWVLVPLLTADQFPTPARLWEAYNEHHFPVHKLVLYVLSRAVGFDFRAGMFLTVFLLAGLSVALTRTASKVRGGPHFADAFFPLVVLGMGQWECILLAYNQIGPTFCTGAILVLLAGAGRSVSPRRAVGLAACVGLLPLLGASALVLVPTLAVWLTAVGVGLCRADDPATRRHGPLVLGLVAGSALLSGLYFVGSQSPAQETPTSSPERILGTGLHLLGLLFGAVEFPGPAARTGVALSALAAGAGVWAAAWQRLPRERTVLLGWLAFLAGMGALVAAIANGRADYLEQAPLVSRYATLLLPLACALYLLWTQYGGRAAGIGQVALLLVAAGMFVPNLKIALAAGHIRHKALRDFETDLAAGLPPALLAERSAGKVFPAEQQEMVTQAIYRLRDSGAAGYRSLPDDQPLAVVALPASAVSGHDLMFTNGVARPVGDDPAVRITLPGPRAVRAVRLHYTYTNALVSADYFDLTWQTDGTAPPRAGRSKILLEAHPDHEERTALIWVDGRIDGLCLTPRIKQFALQLRAVELLVPEGPSDE